MRQKSLLRTILEPLGIALGLAVLVRGAVNIYSIPSESMSPMLQPGDQIVVTRYFGAEPRRGDVIVFESPVASDELVVKRVVGLPGDLVDARLGRVRIGGHTLPEPYVLRAAATGAIDAQLVPHDAYFVLGDNRDESLDSRSWGVVPRESIVGRARMVLWSSRVAATPANASTAMPSHFASTRTPRVFKYID
ncbi:MAG TPA: signal peptidase I [Thermoanaerobaculia bacterium]|nr:signal peptidase I [Thermoanaerobaculia bacterium]